MRTKHILAWMALLVAGAVQAQTQTQAPKPDNDYFLTKATLTLTNGAMPSPLPPHLYGRFAGDSLTIDLHSGNAAGRSNFQLVNIFKHSELPNTNETLNLKVTQGSSIKSPFNSLSHYKNGLQLRIAYKGALPTNAWQMAGATLAMEFRDSSNALHPHDGLVTVKFPTNNVRIGFNAGDSMVSVDKHRDTAYLRTGANFKPQPVVQVATK